MEKTSEISLIDLWNIFKKHAGKIIGFTIIGALISVGLMYFLIKPQYSSRAQLIVVQKQQQEENINLNEIQTSVQLINTYRDILTADAVLYSVNERMNTNYSLGSFKNAISVAQSQNSQAFNVSVTMDSADEAQNVLNNLIDVFEEKVSDVYGEENTNITILSPASFNPNKVSPRLPMYIIIGAMAGLFFSILIVLILEISDTTVKGEGFMQSIGIINLGSISQLNSKDLKSSRIGIDNPKRRKGKV